MCVQCVIEIELANSTNNPSTYSVMEFNKKNMLQYAWKATATRNYKGYVNQFRVIKLLFQTVS